MSIIYKHKIVIGLLIIFADQVMKYLIRQYDGFYICNSGIAFGISIPSYIRWSLTGIMFLGLYFLMKKSANYGVRAYKLGVIFILSGAVSNIIDRLFFGCVIDFIDIKIFNYPMFNVADIFIFIGASYIFIKGVLQK